MEYPAFYADPSVYWGLSWIVPDSWNHSSCSRVSDQIIEMRYQMICNAFVGNDKVCADLRMDPNVMVFLNIHIGQVYELRWCKIRCCDDCVMINDDEFAVDLVIDVIGTPCLSCFLRKVFECLLV